MCMFVFLCWPRLPDRSVILGRRQRACPNRDKYERQISYLNCSRLTAPPKKIIRLFSVCIVCQIAAKIGGDGVAAPSANEFGYGAQKRPLEDAGGYFPMPNLNIGQ